MATLPTLNESPLLPQPAAGLRGISIDGSALAGAGLAVEKERREALRYIAKGLNDIGDAMDEVQLNDDKRAAKDQLTSYSASLRTLLYGDGTPDNLGYYNLKGDDAVNARGKLTQDIEKLRQQYLSKSPNQRVNLLFNDASNALTAPELDNIASHSAKEKTLAEKASSLAAMNEAVSRFAANPGDERIRAQSALVVQNEALAQADAEGIREPEARANLVRGALSKMYQEGVETAIGRDLDAGVAMYNKYRPLIDGQDQSEIEKSIKIAQNARQTEIEHKAVMSRLAAEQADKAAFGEWISKGIASGSLDLQAVANDRRMDGSSKLTLFNFQKALDASADTPSEISKSTTSNLYARMLLPDGNPGKITDESQIVQEFVNKKLNRTDFDWLRKAFQENRTEDGQKLTTQKGKFFDSVKPLLTKPNSFGVVDPQGSQNFYAYQQYVEDRITQARKDGKDPYELLRPGSKDYLGTPEVLQQFQNDAKTVMQNKAAAMSGKAPKPADTVSPIYKSQEDVVNAYKTGKLTWEAASKWLIDNGYAAPAPQGQ